jgi:phenylacetate-CoA ligase
MGHMLMLSSYHLSERNAGQYIEALERFNPVVIQAFPSAISFLARYLASEGKHYRVDALKAVLTSSETLSKEQADLIEERMGCRVFDHYGSLERVVMISTCEHGNLHVNSDYGCMEELVGEDGDSEIVGTGFNNWLMPLFRYRTGDRIARKDQDRGCPCGRRFPLIKRVSGRVDDYVVTADGRTVARLTPVFWGVENIAEAQVVQERVGEIRIVVVPLGEFGEREKQILRVNAAQRLGQATRVTVDVVSQISRGPNGKLQTVVNRIGKG